MKSNKSSCEEMQLKVMALLDGELDDHETAAVKEHLDKCNNCSTQFASLSKVKEVTANMKFKKLPEFYWDEYWKHVYNRIERGLSWIFISIGAIIIFSFAGWKFLNELISDQHIHPFLKVGIFILMVGLIILILSILREKLMIRRVDKYRGVDR